jgi:hypothetical protein
MSDFDNLWESLLLEMPYIKAPTKSGFFDLELEKYKNDWDGLFRMIHNILNSRRAVDKYGNNIELETPQQKERFIDILKDCDQLNIFLQKYFPSKTLF